MKQDELLRIASDEARQALGLVDEPRLKFERRGGVREWNEGIYRNVFQAKFRVWRTAELIDVELDVETGEVLSWRNETAMRVVAESVLTREEAVRIARENVDVPDSAGFPEVTSIMEDGRPITVVTWTFRPTIAAEPGTVEVMIHSGTREVCGIRRY